MRKDRSERKLSDASAAARSRPIILAGIALFNPDTVIVKGTFVDPAQFHVKIAYAFCERSDPGG